MSRIPIVRSKGTKPQPASVVANMSAPNVQKLIALGFSLMDSGNMQRATDAFKKAVDADPGSIEARVNYAACLAECGQSKDALKELDTVITRHPDSFEARGNAAMIAMEVGDTDAAIVHFEGAVGLKNGRSWYDGHYNLANLLADRGAGWESQAIQHYEAALKIDPNAAEAHTNFAACLRTAGRLRDAISHCETATKCNPR